ncbi:MAG: hypothetical protein RIS58_1271, partial [Actinomycetota bacterium]
YHELNRRIDEASRRGREALRPLRVPSSLGHPSATTPRISTSLGITQRSRNVSSPLASAKNSDPSPTSCAAPSKSIVANAASIVQNGAGHASCDTPRPVCCLSASLYRSRYARGSAHTSAITGACSSFGQAKTARSSFGKVTSQNLEVSSPSKTTRLNP